MSKRSSEDIRDVKEEDEKEADEEHLDSPTTTPRQSPVELPPPPPSVVTIAKDAQVLDDAKDDEEDEDFDEPPASPTTTPRSSPNPLPPPPPSVQRISKETKLREVASIFNKKPILKPSDPKSSISSPATPPNPLPLPPPPSQEQIARDAKIHELAHAFDSKHIVGIGSRHIGFEAPVHLELAEDNDDGENLLDPLTIDGNAVKKQTHLSIVELLQRLEDVGKEQRKSRKSVNLKGLKKVLTTALRRHSLSEGADENGDGSELKASVSQTMASIHDGKLLPTERRRRATDKKLMLKDAVHMATETLGAQEVLKEIRERKDLYSTVVEHLMKEPENKKYEKEHPYVVMRKKWADMAIGDTWTEYKIAFRPQRTRLGDRMRNTGIPEMATRQDSLYLAKMKRIKKYLFPLIIFGIVFATAAVLAYDCVVWAFSYCPRCRKVKVKPKMPEIDLPEMPDADWKSWMSCCSCCKNKKDDIPKEVKAASRFYARRKGMIGRLSSQSTKAVPTRMISPGYAELEWSSVEMTAEEAFFSHSVLLQELRRLYIVIGRRIIWNKFCNAIICKKKILTMDRLIWCVIRLHRNSYMKLQLNFVREMIRQSSLSNVTACSSRRVVEAAPGERKHVLVECIMKRIDMKRVIRKEKNCARHGDWISEIDFSTSSSDETSVYNSEDDEMFMTWMRRDTLYEEPSTSEGSSGCSGGSAYRRALGRSSPSDEELRLELTVMVKECLDQPIEGLLRKLRVLKRKRYRKDLRAMALFDSKPQEHFVDFKVSVASGELKGQSIMANIRIVEVDCVDHFVLRRLPVPRPPVLFGVKEKIEQNEQGRDWQHKVFAFVIRKLGNMWNSETFVALSKRNPEEMAKAKKKIADDYDIDIYSFLDPLRTVVVVIETKAARAFRQDKYRWLMPTTKRQIKVENIPGLYFPGWKVKEVNIRELMEREEEEQRVRGMLNDPSDILYHDSYSVFYPRRPAADSEDDGTSTSGKGKQISNKAARIAAQVPDSKFFLLPPRAAPAAVSEEAKVVEEKKADQVFAGQKAMIFLESWMKETGNDIFVGDKRRKALHLSELDLTESTKLQPDDRLPASASYGELLEQRRKQRLVKSNKSEKVAESPRAPIGNKPTVILLKPNVKESNKRFGGGKSLESASSLSSYAQSMKESNRMFLALPENVRRRFSMDSRLDVNFGRGSIFGTPEATAERKKRANLEYVNLKNDKEEYRYYKVGKALVVERRKEFFLSTASRSSLNRQLISSSATSTTNFKRKKRHLANNK